MAVVNLHTFPPGSRKAFRIGGKNGRRALLLNNRGNLHCIDAQCFHFGGPLWEAPIEELGDRSCLKCPWHEYRIDIATGHCFDNFGTSQGLQQRTHHVHVDQLTGDVYVKENLPVFGQRPMGSDKYCDKKTGANAGPTAMQSGRRAGAASAARRARLARMQAEAASQRGQQSILDFAQQRKPAAAKVPIQYNDATPQKAKPPSSSHPNLEHTLSQQLTQPSTPLSSSSSSSQQNFFSQHQSSSQSSSQQHQQHQPARRTSDSDLEQQLTQKDNLSAAASMFGGASPSPATPPQHSQMRQQSLTEAFRSTRRQTQKVEHSQKVFSSHANAFASPSPLKGLNTHGASNDEYTLTQPDDLTQKQLRFDDHRNGDDEDMMDDDQAMGGMTDDEDGGDYQLTQPRGAPAKTLRQSSIASFFSQR